MVSVMKKFLVPLLMSLGFLTGCSSSDGSCLIPRLSMFPDRPAAGQEVQIGAIGLRGCSRDRGVAGGIVPPGTNQIHLSIATGKQPSGTEIPVSSVAVVDWVTVAVDLEEGTIRGTGRIPLDLPPGQYYLFAQESNVFRSSYFSVAARK